MSKKLMIEVELEHLETLIDMARRWAAGDSKQQIAMGTCEALAQWTRAQASGKPRRGVSGPLVEVKVSIDDDWECWECSECGHEGEGAMPDRCPECGSD